MINSYNSQKKQSFIKRMLNTFFNKNKRIEAPIEYSQKEIMQKSNDIINFLNSRYSIF